MYSRRLRCCLENVYLEMNNHTVVEDENGLINKSFDFRSDKEND